MVRAIVMVPNTEYTLTIFSFHYSSLMHGGTRQTGSQHRLKLIYSDHAAGPA